MTQPFGKQARKTAAFFLLLLSTLAADPSGPEIMERARDTIRAQTISVTGQLRTGASRVPFQLEQKDGLTTYTFADPTEKITVTLGDDGVKISGAKDPTQPVRASLLTYEDLTLSFLYWKKITADGNEKILSLPCWRLRLDAPNRSSTYAFVKLWVNRQSGAFLRAQAFDWTGTLVKQFQVIGTQTIDGRYFLKQMRIQNLQPKDPAAETITYLEIDKPQA